MTLYAHSVAEIKDEEIGKKTSDQRCRRRNENEDDFLLFSASGGRLSRQTILHTF